MNSLKLLHLELADMCGEIADRFQSPMKITIIARNPANPECETLVGDDDLEEVIALVRRMQSRNEVAQQPTRTRPA